MPPFVMSRSRGLLVLAGFGAVASLVMAQSAPKPTGTDRATAQVVAALLERGHLAKPTINDEVAKKWARNYLKGLDPFKYYFIKADVDEFLARETTLDDEIREGNLDFARNVFERFLKRSDERLADAQAILKEAPDFTVEESIADDPDRIGWPADAAEAKDRLRKIIKLDLLRSKVGGEKPEESVKRLAMRYRDIHRAYKQFDNAELLERYLSALSTVVDPHSSYMSSKTLEDMVNQQLHLSLEGIGASLITEDGYPVVKEIVAGGAADKDGRLEIEDKIVGIENPDGTREDFVEKKLSDVVRKIRGPKGSKVRLLVQPADAKDIKTYELTREKIELKEQRAKGQVIEAKVEGREKPFKLGVINLPAFYGDTQAVLAGEPDAVSATSDCRRLIDDFKKQKVDAVVVDLRGNGGGLLKEAIDLSGLFIDTGPVVQVREANNLRALSDDDEGTAWDGPMAVLIDHLSASASEIFAGVIKDYGRGLIVGDSSTFGKGTVQSIVPLNERLRLGGNTPNLGALKLTIQQFYRPNGDSTQIKGVEPDVHIPSFRDLSEIGEGKLDSALKFDKVAPLSHDYYNRAPKDLVAQLMARSETRRKGSTKFQEDVAYLKKLADRKARHEISLNEAKYRAETRAEDEDDDAKPKKKGKKPRHANQPAWESNYYNDEVLAILGDYLSLGKTILIAAPVRAGQVARPLMP